MGKSCENEDDLRMTNFKKTELKRWYSKFRKDYPVNDREREERFNEVFGSVCESQWMSKRYEVDSVFDFYDVDGNGCITKAEMNDVFSFVKGKESSTNNKKSVRNTRSKICSKEDIEKIFESVDSNKDGVLSREEFVSAIKINPDVWRILSPNDSPLPKVSNKMNYSRSLSADKMNSSSK